MTEPPGRTRRFAGIDIGTLTCRLLIADLVTGQPLQELRSERRILRLGEGVDRTKRLSASAMDRVIQCLHEWKEVVDSFHVDACMVVATSAVRDATNRNEFLERVKREVGFEVEIITGDEEARRTLLGIRSGLPAGATDILALDIGGGSTEFILDRSGQKPMVRSIDIGVVRLCERVLHHDPPSHEEVRQAREWVAHETKTAVVDMGDYRQATFVGTAGTITSLAAMAQNLPAYEPARIQNYRLKLETICELEQALLSKAKAERIELPGLEKGREEVITAGAIIIRTIMEMLGQKQCLVSDLGLREGMLIDLVMCSSSADGAVTEELPAYAHNLGKVLNEWLEVSNLLLADGQNLMDVYKNDWASQPFRRMFVRACWALIEGEVFCLKQFTLRACELGGKSLSFSEHKLLSEVLMLWCDNGRVKREDVRESAHENLKQTLKIATAKFELGWTPDFGNQSWEMLRRSLDLRHRVTHPKTAAELTISDDELDDHRKGVAWFLETVQKFQTIFQQKYR
ncbi:MAG: Ppx/GppA family phosphatase [Nitrospira sp.]|nr:Ppx/GppA family phosphatase [Nitrospira sp.]